MMTIPIPEATAIPEEVGERRRPEPRSAWANPWLWVGIIGGVIGTCVLIVVLMAAGGKAYKDALDEAMLDTAKGQVKLIETAIHSYKLRFREYPPDLASLTVQQADGSHPYLEANKIYVPWSTQKNPIMYGYEIQGPVTGGPRNGGLKPDVYFLHPETGVEIGNWPGSP